MYLNNTQLTETL